MQPVKHIIINADDFGISPDVDRAIVDLIQKQRVSSTSLMSWYAPDAASLDSLRTLHRNQQVNVGLHLDFTSVKGGNNSIKKMIFLTWLRRLSTHHIKSMIAQQLSRFETLIGTPPDFIDGHEHVHQFPQIRNALIETLQQRYGVRHIFIRNTSPSKPYGFKAFVIGALGARALHQLSPYKSNTAFAGVYGFEANADLPQLWQQWLTQMPARGGLIMCHPSMSTPALAHEYKWLASDAFADLLHTHNATISGWQSII